MAKVTFETLSVDEKVRAKRGRKPNIDQELVEAIAANLKEPGSMLRFSHFGHVMDPDDRSKVQQQIRNAAKVAIPDQAVSIEWVPNGTKQGNKDISGFPQLSLRRQKVTATA